MSACPVPLPSTAASNCDWANYAQQCPQNAGDAFGGVLGDLELGSLNLVCGNLDNAATAAGAAAGTALQAAAAAAGNAAGAAVSSAIGVPRWITPVVIAAALALAAFLYFRVL